jgi:hypothetical protein
MCKVLLVEIILELCRRLLDLVATWNLLRIDALDPFSKLFFYSSHLAVLSL